MSLEASIIGKRWDKEISVVHGGRENYWVFNPPEKAQPAKFQDKAVLNLFLFTCKCFFFYITLPIMELLSPGDWLANGHQDSRFSLKIFLRNTSSSFHFLEVGWSLGHYDFL